MPDRVGVADDHGGRRGEVGGDPPRGVEVEEVVERGLAALQLGRVGERAVAMGRLAVEGGPLVRVLAVGRSATFSRTMPRWGGNVVPVTWLR